MSGTSIPNPSGGISASDRMVDGHRGIGPAVAEGDTSWLSIAAWQGWVGELFVNGSHFFGGILHGLLFGRTDEKIVDGRKVKVQTPGLVPESWDTASKRGQNAVALGAGGWIYYSPTLIYAMGEGLFTEIKGIVWDMPWAIYDGSLLAALKLGMDALFSDAATAFSFGKSMGADMIREIGDAATGPLKGLVAAVGRLLGSLLPDIVGAVFTGGGSLILRGGMKLASKTAQLAPELLSYLTRRAMSRGRNLNRPLARALASSDPVPSGPLDRPVIDTSKPVTLPDEAPARRTATQLADGDDVRGIDDRLGAREELVLARDATVSRGGASPDLSGGRKLANPAHIDISRLKWLDDMIAKHGLVFEPDILEFLKTTYRAHRKLELDKDTIEEVAALAKIRRDGDLMASRAAQGELDTLKFLDDDALVEGIRMIRQTTSTRTPDFEVRYRSGPNAGELRQIEVRTITRTRWLDGNRVDNMHKALRESAARFAAYSKLRRSRMPKALDDRKTLSADGTVSQSEYLYKTQIYDRGTVSVQIAGDLEGQIPMSPREIELLRAAMARSAPTHLVDAQGVARAFAFGELANIESVWIHYVSHGVLNIQVLELLQQPQTLGEAIGLAALPAATP